MSKRKDIIIKGRKVFPETNSIQFKGKVQKIEPKLMRLLLLLNNQTGKVVSKKEIIDHVWEDIIVTDDSVTKAISKLRKIFNDRAEIIETIRGKGYRLNDSQFLSINLRQFQILLLITTIVFLLYILFASGLVAWVIDYPYLK